MPDDSKTKIVNNYAPYVKGLKAIVFFISVVVFCSTSLAQVSTLTGWTLAYHGTSTSAQTTTVTVPAGTGTYRCMVVAIATNRTTAGSRTVTLTYGGQSFTSVQGDVATGTVQQHTQLYYLNDAGIDAATNTTLSVTVSGGTSRITDVWYAIYDAVDQTTPITDSKTYSSGTGTTNNPVFASALTVNASDLAVEVLTSHRVGNTTPRTITYATNWTMADEETSTSTDGIRNAVANRSIPGSNTTDVSSTTYSGATLASMTGMTLKVTPKIFRTNTASVTWGTAGNWQQSTDGGANWVTATTAPTSSDGLVTIRNGHTVSLGAAATASALTIDAGGAFTTTGTAGRTLSVTGTTTVAGTITFANASTHTFSGDIVITGTWNETAAAVLNIAGNVTNNASSFTASTGVHTFSGLSKVLSGSTATVIPNTTISGTYTNNGTLTVSAALAGAGAITQGVSSILNIGGTSAITTIAGTANTNTINYTGAAQTVKDMAYRNLGLSGSGAKTLAAATTVSENLTMSGTVTTTTVATMTIGGNLTVGTGTTFTMGNFAFTVTGTTSISGTINTATGATGTRTFTGAVTINSGGVWNLSGQNPPTSFASGITMSGTTFNNGSGAAAFSANQSLAGAVNMTFGGSVTPAASTTLTNNNTATVTIAGTLTLTGNFTQGANAILALSGATPFGGAATFNASSNTNTVNYTGAAQTVKFVSYSNLGLSGSGAKTMTSITTINGNVTLSGTATATTAAIVTIGGNLSVGTGTTFTMGNFAFTVTGTTSITGTIATGTGATGTRTFTGAVTINSGGTWNLSGQNPPTSFASGITMSGTTFNNGTGAAAFSASQSLAGAGNMTFGGTVTPAVSTTLTNNNTGTVTVGGVLTLTGSFTQGTNAILALSAATANPFSGAGTFDASTNANTVNYTRAGAQTIKAINYSSLGVSGGNTKTLAGSLTVSGVLTVGTTTTLSFGTTAITLTLSGTATNRLVNNGTAIDMSGSNATHVLQIAASSIATFGTVTPGTGSTIEYNASGAQTVFVRTYNHLKLSGSGAKTSAVTTITRNLELSGTVTLSPTAALSIGGTLTIGNGTTFTAAAFALTVTGTTTVGGGASGTLTISSATGTKAFNGDLIVNAGATFNNTAANVALTLPGSLSNFGTINSGTGVYTLSGTSKTLAGTISIPNVTVTGTYTNNGTLTVGTALSGAGTLTQGLNSNLALGGTFGITGLVAVANGNTITYSGSSAQNVRVLDYQNLEVNNASNISLQANTLVQENVILTNGKINLSSFNLSVTGAVLGASSGRYILTGSTGRLMLFVGNSPITFPVGNSAYNPFIIANPGTNDWFGVRVIDAVSSPAVNSSTLLVNRFWNVTEGDAGGSNVTVTAQWATADQNAGYAGGTNVKFGYHNGTAWTEVLSSQSGSNPSITASASFDIAGDDLTTGRTFGVGKDLGFLSNAKVINVGSLSTFGSQCVGSTSDEQSYTVSGVNLTANIVVTAPSGYEVSTTSGSGFGSSLNLVPSSGSVSPTPVFVRFAPGSAGTFNGNITHTSTGANNPNVAVTGTGGNFGPTVTSPTSSAIGATEVNLGGNITNLGCSSPTIRGVEYSTTNGFANGTGTQVNQSGTFGTGTFTVNVTGLNNNTTYYYKAYATNAQGTSYSSQGTFATLVGARYSAAAGAGPFNWNSTATWSATSGGATGASVPTTGQAVFIEGNRTVTINASTAANLSSLNIDAGSTVNFTAASAFTLSATTINVDGTLTLNSTGAITATTVNVNNGGIVNRTVSQTFAPAINVNSGGKYTHAVNGVALPIATWNANSTCEVTGRAGTALTGLNQSFGNFIWNCTSQSTNTQNLPNTGAMSIAGTLTINSTGSQSLILNQSSLSVGNYTQTGGTFNLCNSNGTTRTLNITGNFSHTAGTISVSGNSSTIGSVDFAGTTTQTFTSGGTLSESTGKIRFNINTDAIVDFGTSIISSGASGIFTNSGTLITQNTAGITNSGATGTVQSTGTRNYNGTGSYVYNGVSGQATGNGLVQCANLTINNAAGVSLSSPVTINNAGLLSIGTVTTNTIFNDGGNQLSVTGGIGTIDLTMDNGSTFNVGSASTGTTIQDVGTFNLATGTTIAYTSDVAQTVGADPPYQALNFSGAGTKTVSGPLTVAQNWSTSGGAASLGTSIVSVAGNITGTGAIQLSSGTINVQGNWTNTGTLTPGTSTITFDGSGPQTIGSGTSLSFNHLNISNDDTKTLGAAISSSGVFTIDNGLILNTANFGVTLIGDLVNNGTINGGSSAFTITGTAAQSIDRFTTTGAISMTKTGGVATFASNVSGSSLTLNGVGGTLSLGAGNDITISGNWINTNGTLQGGSSTLHIGGASSSFAGGTFTGEDGTIDYNAAGAQAMAVVPYNNLSLSGSGAKTGAITTVNGNVLLSGTATTTTGATLTIGGTLTIENGTTFTAAAFPLTVAGVTTVGGGASGTLTISSSTGAKAFNDDVIINAGATLNNSANAPVTLAGGISNAGTFTAGSGVYTFSGSDKDITGTIAIPSVSISGTYNNYGTLTVATSLAGAGSLIQAASSVLNIGGTATLSTLDAGVNANTVNFTNTSGGQSIPSFTYHHLTMSNSSGTQTASSDIIVNGTLTTTTGGTLSLGANSLSGSLTGVTNNGTISTTNTSGSPLPTGKTWGGTVSYAATSGGQTVASATSYNNLTLNNSSGIQTMGGNATVNGVLTLTSGGKFAIGNNYLLTLNGTVSGMSATAPLVGNTTGASLSIGGSGALGTSLFFDQTVVGTSNRLTNLTLNRASQTIILGNILQVTGTVTPTAGTLSCSPTAADTNLVLISDAGGTARIAAGPSNNYITGKVKIQRFIPANARRWRFMGSTVQSATLADWKNETYITGPGSGNTIGTNNSNGFDATGSNAASVYSYNEASPGDLNVGWTAVTNITNTLSAGKGFRVFIRGDRSNLGRLDGTVGDQNAVTMDLGGTPNQGDITMPVSFTSSGTNGNDGWCLVANPYASPYDWKAFHNADSTTASCFKIDPTVWVLDAQNGGYRSYNAKTPGGDLTNGIIPAGASFWVKAYAANPTLVFKEQYKVGTTPDAIFKTSEGEGFNIRLYYDSITWDGLTIKYKEGSAAEYDEYDIRKLTGTVTLSTYGTDTVQLAYSCRPISSTIDTIRLNVTGAAGSYELKFTNNNLIAVADNAFLFDTYTSIVTDLKTADMYSFDIESGVAASQGLSRFYIVVGNNGSLPVKLLHFTARKTIKKQVELRWATAQETNSKSFEVERSADGKQYSTIGTLAAGGNTHALINYNTIDAQPFRSNYYRLKQVDVDGAVSYSKVEYVLMEEMNTDAVKMYPIPAQGSLTIEHTQPVNLFAIYDISGKKLYIHKGDGMINTIDISNLKTGVYILDIISESGDSLKTKFVKE